MIGANIDVTKHKQTAQELAERTMQPALAGKSTCVGQPAYDADTAIMPISAGYAAIHGFPEGTTEITRSECLLGVHPDDIGRVEQSRGRGVTVERRSEYKARVSYHSDWWRGAMGRDALLHFL